MRIIQESNVSGYKLTVFVNSMRYSCKIESPAVEMIFKLPEHAAFSDPAAVLNFINETLALMLNKQMQMNEASYAALLSSFLSAPADEEEII